MSTDQASPRAKAKVSLQLAARSLQARRKKPCQRAENPYKPRHPWIPAGS